MLRHGPREALLLTKSPRLTRLSPSPHSALATALHPHIKPLACRTHAASHSQLSSLWDPACSCEAPRTPLCPPANQAPSQTSSRMPAAAPRAAASPLLLRYCPPKPPRPVRSLVSIALLRCLGVASQLAVLRTRESHDTSEPRQRGKQLCHAPPPPGHPHPSQGALRSDLHVHLTPHTSHDSHVTHVTLLTLRSHTSLASAPTNSLWWLIITTPPPNSLMACGERNTRWHGTDVASVSFSATRKA
jgi:hypothetical protein